MRDRDRLSLAAAIAVAMTTSALFSVYDSARWLPAVLGVIAVVAAASALARWSRLPLALGPFLVAAAATLYVTVVFASADAVGGLLPGPGALRLLASSAREGFTDIHDLAPPVPSHRGLVLITVVGVALVALVADLLAATLRRPPLAGLPLLALFAVPAAIAPRGTGIVPFALSVAGYLILLGADNRDRLARWGRPLRTSAQLEVGRLTAAAYGEEQPTGAMGRRIGVAAIGLALVVPLLLPTFRGSIFSGNGSAGTGGGSGSSGVVTYNPIVRLKGQLTSERPQTLLRIRTRDPSPTPYLRMAGLDRFDGRTWSQSPLRAGRNERVSNTQALPAPLVAGDPAETRIEVTNALDARWLPVPYQPTGVDVSGDWRYDAVTSTIFSTRANARDASYRVASQMLAPDRDSLQNAPAVTDQRDLLPYQQLPDGMPTEIIDTALRVAKGATQYDKAVAIQQYFRDGFTYSLSVPSGNSSNDVVNFLRGRRGYCEQFAATMALFARIARIPARVAVGFTYGVSIGDGEYVVTSKDAHAWPELYFPGAGWLPFEPTPVAGQTTTSPPSWTQSAAAGAGADGGPNGSRTGANPDPNSGRPLAERKNQGQVDGQGGPLPDLPTAAPAAKPSSSHRWRVPAGLALLVLVLACPSVVQAATRRRRWHAASDLGSAAHAAWADLRDDARDLNLAWSVSASPRGAAAWLRRRAALDDAAENALGILVVAEERASYARAAGAGGHRRSPGTNELREAGAVVRSSLARDAGGSRRWLARCAPRSALDQLGLAANRLSDAFDRSDRILSQRIRALLRRRPISP